ncbi:hypothetical protein B0H16DRAFT_1757799 [Mycena metata]|uniref:C2H2-type domain-containing protein n=1 Tax=Mycena metata TaxID=1033252 RepID=A0AAD7N0Q8_9AGAR|nr:hypothetical protein B0H16DRAFT_1757799 [Mycena metata]
MPREIPTDAYAAGSSTRPVIRRDLIKDNAFLIVFPGQKQESDSNRRATCTTCGATMKRPSDLPRHTLLHAKNKEEYTNARPLQCTVILSDGSRCDFATSDPSSLHRHKKRRHEGEDGGE